jgi:hypothetical protein
MAASDRFTHYLLELDDESFFSLYRNYRGPVETPYNKHDLIGDLRDFVIRVETRQRIIERLDRTDLVILSAVDLLGTPDERRLARFLEGEVEPPALRDRVLNLKDRLLLIDGRGDTTLHVNPLLQEDLVQAGMGAETLVSGSPVSDGIEGVLSAGPAWLSIPFALALYPIIRDNEEFFTRTGSLRKRVQSELETRFATLLDGEAGTTRFRIAVAALETAGLARRREERIELRPESWSELAPLPDRWILGLLWGSALTSSVERAFEYAELLLQLVETVAVDREFTLGEILRLLQLTGNGASLPIDRDTIARLAEIGFLLSRTTGPEDTGVVYRLNPLASGMIPAEFDGPVEGRRSGGAEAARQNAIRVHANMEASAPPGVPYADLLAVAQVAELNRYDVVPSFVFTESSVSAARRDGIDNPLEQVQRVAGELPQNVAFLLRRWQERAGAVRLLRGLVLIAGEEEAAILRKTGEFQELLREEPAPGVFLMVDDPRRIERLLTRLELGASTTVEGPPVIDPDVPEYERLFQRFRQPMLLPAAPPLRRPQGSARGKNHAGGADLAANAGSDAAGGEPDQGDQGDLGDLGTEVLKKHLAATDLPEDVRQEISLRIDRKLILFPEQIREDITSHFGTEARGLDYLGKIRLIEQAIAAGDMLEVVTRSASGSPQRVLVQPREIVQNGNDLMLRARQEPDLQGVRIRIRKISLVRRLSGTLLRRSLH